MGIPIQHGIYVAGTMSTSASSDERNLVICHGNVTPRVDNLLRKVLEISLRDMGSYYHVLWVAKYQRVSKYFFFFF